jgi:hypothetical protein
MKNAPRPFRTGPTCFKRVAVFGALGIGGVAAAGCGTQSAPAAMVSARATTTATHAVRAAATTTTTTPAAPATAPIDRYVAVAKQLYDNETGGAPIQRELRHVAGDPQLLALLRTGSETDIRTYLTSRFDSRWFPNEHVSRMRLVRPGSATLDLGVSWVVWPMGQRVVRTPGRPTATIQVSVQDVIGFVRSMHNKHPAVEVVVRDASGRNAVSLLGAATQVQLPATGFTTIAGVRYEVRSFKRASYLRRQVPVTVWILLPTAAR